MFARPVDPFPSYSPVFASTDVHLKNMSTQSNRRQQQQPPFGACDGGFQYLRHKDQRRQTDQDFGQDQVPQMDSSLRRKRSFHFEPEFVAALDASLHEPSRPRPSKKLRRTVGGFHRRPPPPAPADDDTTTVSDNESRPSIDLERKSFPSRTTSEGPSIIDLSSGEELAALHLGDNEHKRRRESAFDSNSSSESLREVYDVLEDGTVCPVMDHAPVKPSPMKRMRTEKHASNKLVSLDDLEARQRLLHRTPKGTASDVSNSGQEDASWMDMGLDETPSTKRPPTPIADRGALIRYEGPKSMTLADGVEGLLKHRWNESPTLLNTQGNELVLYRRPPPTVLPLQDDDDLYGSTARIEELDDDDDVCLPQNMQDSPIRDLEEGIMDMDLD